MAKRTAEKQLTDRNWEDEEPKEEAGTYVVASEEQLASRQIKKAKRRGGLGSDNSGTQGLKAFAGFSGFTSNNPSSFTSQASFKPLTLTTNGTTTCSKPGMPVQTSTTSASSVNLKPMIAQSTSEIKKTPFTVDEEKKRKPVVSSTGKPIYGSDYWKQLKSLNQSVSDWIQKHVKETPLCDLTPVFRDYEKHLKVLETKYPPTSSDSEAEKLQDESLDKKVKIQASSVSSDVSTPGSTGFTFQNEMSGYGNSSSTFTNTPQSSNTSTASTLTGIKPAFQFSQKNEDLKDSELSKPSFNFSTSSESSNTDSKPGFQFSTDTKQFSFGQNPMTHGFGTDIPKSTFTFSATKSSKNAQQESTDTKEEDDEDEPPKVEVKEVQEEDALYSVRCKLFVKKDGNFVERGLGMLHLKKISNVLQILVRADTNLGNILLNIGIPSSLPISKQGKNNLMLISPLNPPMDKTCAVCKEKYANPQESNVCSNGCQAEPMPLLIRVKNSDMADELLDKINLHKISE